MLLGLDVSSLKKYQCQFVAIAAIVLTAGMAASTVAQAQQSEENRYHADTYQSITLQHAALGPVHTTGVVSPGANFYEF